MSKTQFFKVIADDNFINDLILNLSELKKGGSFKTNKYKKINIKLKQFDFKNHNQKKLIEIF